MRQRSIHSIAHWTIMTLLLLFPVLMVGISSFAQDSQEVTVTETYEYETNEVNNGDNLVVGNIYYFNLNLFNHDEYNYNVICDFIKLEIGTKIYTYYNSDNLSAITLYNLERWAIELDLDGPIVDFYFDDDTYLKCYIVLSSNGLNDAFHFYHCFSASDYLGEKTTGVQITNANYKQDINNWCSEFINLPVNGWYQSLMNVMGIGLTNNSVMNVIYVMPLYIIWVFILDLVVDIILVIVRLPHKALNKLGGENE